MRKNYMGLRQKKRMMNNHNSRLSSLSSSSLSSSSLSSSSSPMQIISSTMVDLALECEEGERSPMLQAVCEAAQHTQKQMQAMEKDKTENKDAEEEKERDLSKERNIPSAIAAAIASAKENGKKGGPNPQKNIFNIGMAIQASTFLMLMIRSEIGLAKQNMCWARLLKSSNVSEKIIRQVNVCLSVSKRLWKAGEGVLPTADTKTVECIFCTLYALLKSDRRFLSDVFGDMVEGIPRKYLGILRDREREFQEITDNFMFIFGDVEKNNSPPFVCISKDEQYITLSIGSPVTF